MQRSGRLNRALAGSELDEYAPLDRAARAVLRRELDLGRLSGRGLHRVRRVARTLADLDDSGAATGETDLAEHHVRVGAAAPCRVEWWSGGCRMTNADDQAHAAALAGLNSMNPPRLRSLLGRFPPRQAWEVAIGERGDPVAATWFRRNPSLLDAFCRSARARPPDETWERCVLTGTRVLLLGDDEYPELLAGDPEAPAVLFCRGDLGALRGRRAGVVGTRNATEGGRRLATRLGRELAEAGVAVVSGLARGIDGAAHRGAVSAISSAGAPVPRWARRSRSWRAVRTIRSPPNTESSGSEWWTTGS